RTERMFNRLNRNLAKMDSARTAELRKQTAEMQKQKRIASTTKTASSQGGRSGPPGGLASRLGRASEALEVKRFRKESQILRSQDRGSRLLESMPSDSADPIMRGL